MEFLRDEVSFIVKNIWREVMAMDVTQVDEASEMNSKQRFLSGSIQISGAWRGVVSVHYTGDLGRRIASIMFDVPIVDTTDEDLRDAMAELVNMVGGNIKGHLPRPSNLSLPTVADGADFTLSVPGSAIVSKTHFECDGQVLVIEMFELPADNEPTSNQTVAASA